MRTAGHISKDVLQAPGFMSLVYWPEFNTRNENLGILGTKRSAANVLLQNMTPEAGKTALGKTLGNNSRWEQKCRGGREGMGCWEATQGHGADKVEEEALILLTCGDF